jgi:hypothetical protein
MTLNISAIFQDEWPIAVAMITAYFVLIISILIVTQLCLVVSVFRSRDKPVGRKMYIERV